MATSQRVAQPSRRPRTTQALSIALVNAPFASAKRPSIQCGLLKSLLVREGHEVDVHYLNLDLAHRIGGELYSALSDERRNDLLLGDWLFAVAAFGDAAPSDTARYAAEATGLDAACKSIGVSIERLAELRADTFPLLVDRWADGIDWSRYQMVGFTTTFEQTVAALALASRVKQVAPHAVVVFGGANVDDEMGPELVRCFPHIDFAVVGEGDVAAVEMAQAVATRADPLGIPGVIGRHEGKLALTGRAANAEDLDALPDPDYSDYFAAVERLGVEQLTNGTEVVLPFESARGCWWGQKHHCTFCGLNGSTMTFRSKSPERVAEELRRLSSRYRLLTFEAVDNIMDTRYLPRLWKPLAEQRWDYSIFYEVKANLKRDQLCTMAEAGVTAIQPGIESLSTNVLRLMRKGTTMLQNVRLLKWARHYGISVAWNLIMGFPGETVADYEAQIELFPLLWHLPPSTSEGPIWLERFSPYFSDPELGLRRTGPKPAYRHVYPDHVNLDRVAYFFDYEFENRLPESLFRHVSAQMELWRARHRAETIPVLVYQRSPDWIQFFDRRGEETPETSWGDALDAVVYEACGDVERTPAQVAEELADRGERPFDEDKVQGMLDGFCDRRLMICEEGKYLSLALPVRAR